MIESKHLNFAYGRKNILTDLDFKMPEGEISYLAGVNGSGKTTWIKCAVGLLSPQSGQVLFDGQTFEKIRDSFGICFDTPPVYPHLSCRDNLFILYKISCRSDREKELLDKMGISDYILKRPAGKISYGQRHRLGVAGAILRHPKYLILDEPDLGLDPFVWETVKKEICILKEQGANIILTGQNFGQIEELIDRVYLLSGGRIAEEVSMADFRKKYGNKSGAEALKAAFINAEGGSQLES